MKLTPALLLASVLLVLTACAADLEDTLGRYQTERQLAETDLAELRDRLDRARLDNPDGELVAETAEAVDNAAARVAGLDAAVAVILDALESNPDTGDPALDTAQDLSTTASAVSSFLPEPYRSLLAILGVAGSTAVAGYQRRRRLAVEIER